MPYYVYVLLCEDGTFYTGYTKDIKSRLEQHKKGIGAKYTRSHKTSKLVYLEQFISRAEAMRREQEIKTYSKARKEELIKGPKSKLSSNF
jgi:putative endonuclease